MGLSKITVNKGSGGLGRQPTTQDHISGLLFFNNTLPSGFGASDRTKVVYSTEEAEALGVTVGTHPVEHYHIDEFFKANPTGELWVSVHAVPAGAYDFTEINVFNNVVQGRCRQLGVFNANDEAFTSTQVTTIQGIIDALSGSAKEMIVLFHGDMNGIAHGSLPDLRALSAPNVAVIAGEDGGATGKALRASQSHSISALGAYLGHISRSPVNESAGYVANHNFSDGVELETPALATGTGDLVSTLTEAALGAVKDKGYSILRKYTPEVAGTYSERMPAAVASTNDFAWIELMRTMNKAVRQLYVAIIPDLNRPLVLNNDGTLTDELVDYFEGLGEKQLNNMFSADEISGDPDEGKFVIVNPAQNVLSTSTLVITVKIIPTGTSEFITVNIGFTTSIS